MDIENTRIFKYTFMIIPFKFTEEIYEGVTRSNYFEPCDHKKIKYDRLYKHIADSISSNNAERTIFDYWFNREENLTEYFRNTLVFKVMTENKKLFKAEGYLKDLFLYCFKNGIGFFVLNFVFDENVDFNTMCEILNKLKKVNRVLNNSKFEISLNNEKIDIYKMLCNILEKIDHDADLFFQHSSKEYMSATMFNSFTYFEPQEGAAKQKLEEEILHQLECLKRSQGSSFGAFEDDNKNYIRPFQNMSWAFSTQGIANINYNDPTVGNINFLQSFYKNVKREYLLMALIILNQEFVLLDYCQKFTSSVDKKSISEELNRLYDFKLHGTFTTVSHLEHYRTFYSHYSEELGIQEILEEVNTKQNAIYLSHENKITEEKTRRDKNINRFTKVLSVILSIFGITGLINNVANLLNRDNALVISSIVVAVVIVAIALVMIVSAMLEKYYRLKTEREMDEMDEKQDKKNKK